MTTGLDELWIMDVLHDGYAQGDLMIMDNARLRSQWGREYAPSRPARVEAALRSLLRCGFVTCMKWDNDEWRPFVRRLPELIDSEWLQATTFGLTFEGGCAWETWAEPDWSRYMEESWDEWDVPRANIDGTTHCGIAEFRVASQQRLDEVLAKGSAYWNVTFSCNDPLCRIVAICPFTAFYWKQLLQGFECRVPYRRESAAIAESKDVMFRKWRRVGFRTCESFQVVQ